MTKKSLIWLLIILTVAISTFCIWTARLARAESDRILSEFKKVDSSISVQDIKEKEGVGAIKMDSSSNENLELSFKANKILVTIDSVKTELQELIDRGRTISFSSKNIERFRTLKMDLLDYNSFFHKNFNNNTAIVAGDFIDVSDQVKGRIRVPWEVYYFEKANFYSASTRLTFVYNKVSSLRQKALNGD